MNQPQVTEITYQQPWYKEINKKQWKSLFASGLGWMLDAMDVMIYSMVLVYIMKDLNMSQSVGGFLATLTLISSALGGLIFGIIADRFGRIRSLIMSIFIYSIFTFFCGFSQTVTQLAIFRFLLGLGMGGEWVAGAALVTESWPAKHRGKAMGFVQSSWAIGYALAAVVTSVLVPLFQWRSVFFFGIVPAFIILLVRKGTEEPDIWKENSQKKEKGGSLISLFRSDVRKWTILGASLSICAQFGYWGLFTWIPAYLATPVNAGGAGLDIVKSTIFIVIMQVGAWLGYSLFGFMADRYGRKITFIIFFGLSAILVPVYGMIHNASVLLIIGPFVAFFGSGYFSGFGTVLAELFPTDVRATGQGFCYNFGRALAAFAPFIIGILAASMGLGAAFGFLAIAFAVAVLLVIFFLPETKGWLLK